MAICRKNFTIQIYNIGNNEIIKFENMKIKKVFNFE